MTRTCTCSACVSDVIHRFLMFLRALEDTYDIDPDVLKDTINQVYRLQAEVKKD